MEKLFHPENGRGFADHGWLKTNHSFSFANWYDPEKVHFGKLRVLNDDIIAPMEGFGIHPHENMEIISIPLCGALAHKDDQGHEEIIKPNEIQVMSAGTGIHHSEYNPSEKEAVNLLQIWIFPDKKGYAPRYDQKSFDPAERKNKLQTVVSPDKQSGSLSLNQNTYFSLCDLDENKSLTYRIKSTGNGVYLFVIDGKIISSDLKLNRRDALGIWDTDHFEITAEKSSSILLIEVPMK